MTFSRGQIAVKIEVNKGTVEMGSSKVDVRGSMVSFEGSKFEVHILPHANFAFSAGK
jgi:hypothetical protein